MHIVSLYSGHLFLECEKQRPCLTYTQAAVYGWRHPLQHLEEFQGIIGLHLQLCFSVTYRDCVIYYLPFSSSPLSPAMANLGFC